MYNFLIKYKWNLAILKIVCIYIIITPLVIVLEKVKISLRNRGVNTIRSLGKAFKTIDSFNGDRKVDKEEFYWGLKDFGVTISKKEAELLLDHLDTNDDGFVNFDEFLVAIRGRPNQKRQAFIDKAFLKFDRDGNGKITSSDLKTVYNCKMHPKVQSGEISEDEVFVEFL